MDAPGLVTAACQSKSPCGLTWHNTRADYGQLTRHRTGGREMLDNPCQCSELICLQKMCQGIQSRDKKPEAKQPGQILLPPRHLAWHGLCPDTVLLWVSSFSGCRKVGSIVQDISKQTHCSCQPGGCMSEEQASC